MNNPIEQFYQLVSLIENGALRNTCKVFPEHVKFMTWPAALGHHHAYEQGLVTHTVEVTKYALHIAKDHPSTNHDTLIAAALWHDLGKVWEYELVAFDGHHEIPKHALQKDAHGETTEYWVRDTEARHHILSSAQEFVIAAHDAGVDRKTEDAVVHCILAHHGPVKEWGSPEAPRTIEALILHQADMLSAGYGATKSKP